MQHYRTSTEILEPSRLDPYYYSPHFVAHAAKMRSVFASRFRMGDEFHVLDGTHDSVNTSDFENDEFCIPFLRAQDIGPGLLKSWTGAFLRRADHLGKCKRSRIVHGDVLLNIMASTGEACFYENSYPAEANANRAVGILRANSPQISPEYKRFLCALLSSNVGNLELARNLKGSIQQRLNLSDISDFTVPRIDNRAARYIGDKVQQAERLRLSSKHAAKVASESLRGSIPIELPPSFNSNPRRVSCEFASPDSLNPEYGRALLGHTLIANGKPLSYFVSSCQCGEPIREDERVSGDIIYYGASGPIDHHNESNFDGEYLIVAQDGTIGRACVARGRFWANNHVWVLKVKSEYDFDAIAAYLDQIYPFWKGMTTGSVVPKVTSENLLKVVVPLQIATAREEVGEPLRVASSQRDLVDKLVQAAKLLVESLIEGSVSEADLSHAQTRLDQDDYGPDREILSRLFSGGIDATGSKPLFPDLDAYYEMLRHLDAAEPAEEAV